ncbi:MAG: NBR1-Ig-like domain-containing protein [Chloroflexi bacterium]|nr:NBR1-Ig-like domain-containing protein [Chloroflexota bacterium]
MKRIIASLSVLLIFTIFLTSCNFPFVGGEKPLDENTINTSVALTLAANPTVQSALTVEAPPPAVVPSITPVPLGTVAIPPTPIPPTPVPTQDTCNRASWIEDVTFPDGSIFLPNVAFVKTWRVKNVGSCTWNSNYAIVFKNGDQMNAPAATQLLGNVAPGATVDLSVNMKSPAANGEYQANFMFRSDTGILFGTGSTFNVPVYTLLEVSNLMLIPTLNIGGIIDILDLEALVYDFSANYCIANWRNASDPGYLACPGAKTDAQGFVIRVDSPKLQDNKVYTGVALLTHPQWIDGGSVSGTYPLITIENNMRFRAKLGCGFGGNACNVRFFLRYRVEGGTLEQLGQWDVQYSDAPVNLDVDLSALAGKNVNIVLQTVTNGSSAQDWGHWVNPRIIK